MLANFLAKSKPINFILYLGLFFCFYLITLFSKFFVAKFTWNTALESGLFLLLFLTIFFFFNFVVSKNKLTFDNSYAFFLFTLTTILLISKLIAFKALILMLIYLLFLRKIYSLRSSKKVIQKIFDSGFWLGILCIIEPFSILFFTLIYAAILLQQKVTINHLLTPIIGYFSPLIIYFAYLIWKDIPDEFTELFYLDVINNVFIYAEDGTIWIFGSLILLTIVSIFLKSPKALSINNTFKKSWILLIINLIIAVVFALVISEKDGSEIIFLLVPAAIIIANGFEVIEKIILKNILFSGLLIATILSYFLL